MTEPAYRTTRKVLSVPVCWDDSDATYNVNVAEKSFSRKPFRKEVQCTLSLCIGVLVFTVVIFLLCGHDPSKVYEGPWRPADRAVQHQFDVRLPHRSWRTLQASSVAANNDNAEQEAGKLREQQEEEEKEEETALEGMGTLFRRGRRAMSELLVAHLAESTSACDLRLFLRTLHRSGMTSRADVVLLFPWRPLPAAMVDVIHEEEESFHKLLSSSKPLGAAASRQSKLSDAGDAPRPFASRDGAGSSTIHTAIPAASSANISVFNAAAFWKSSADTSRGRSIWGNRSYHDRSARVEGSAEEDHGSAYGAIVGFDVQELDPADAMRAFINEPPAALRRWMCYQILLGMVRQKYRHVMLSEVKGLLIFKDILAPLKKKDTGLYLFAQDHKWDERVSVLDTRQSAVELGKSGQDLLIDDNDDDDLGRDNENIVLERRVVENSINIATVSEGQDGDLDQLHLQARKLMNKRAKSMEMKQAGPRPGRTDQRQHSGLEAGLIEQVYGKQVWDSLEKEDKGRRVLSSAVIMGGMRSVRSLASAMATEIVRVAILRKSRQAFNDEAILSHLVHKSSVLGRKVASHLHIVVASGDSSSINLLSGSSNLLQSTTSSSGSLTMFFRSTHESSGLKSLGTMRNFAVIQGYYSASDETRKNLLASLHKDICKFSSLADHSQVYIDCMEHLNLRI